MRGPDPGPGGVVVLLALGESQVLVQGLVSPASHYEGAVTQPVNCCPLVSPGVQLSLTSVLPWSSGGCGGLRQTWARCWSASATCWW